MKGIEATARIARETPSARVIILSTHSDEEHVLGALHAGAEGYLLKNSATHELKAAVLSVAKGGTYLRMAYDAPDRAECYWVSTLSTFGDLPADSGDLGSPGRPCRHPSPRRHPHPHHCNG